MQADFTFLIRHGMSQRSELHDEVALGVEGLRGEASERLVRLDQRGHNRSEVALSRSCLLYSRQRIG